VATPINVNGTITTIQFMLLLYFFRVSIKWNTFFVVSFNIYFFGLIFLQYSPNSSFQRILTKILYLMQLYLKRFIHCIYLNSVINFIWWWLSWSVFISKFINAIQYIIFCMTYHFWYFFLNTGNYDSDINPQFSHRFIKLKSMERLHRIWDSWCCCNQKRDKLLDNNIHLNNLQKWMVSLILSPFCHI